MEKTNKELIKRFFYSIYLRYKDIYLKAASDKLLFY